MHCNGTAEAFTSIHHKFSQLSEAQTQRCIYKVHNHLRNVKDKAYEPEIIAIGPYHRGKHNLKMMEEHKLRYLELLLHRKKENVEIYISAIGKLEKQARNCYAEPISLNTAKFIEMLSLYPGAVDENRTNRSSHQVTHLLDLIHNNWWSSFDDVYVDVDIFRVETESRFIHSATELTDANVKFQKSKSHSLFDVDFKKGIMLMSTLTIEDRTECFFRNLIVYEQYFKNNRPNFVTDYVRLLDNLINSSRDVEILSQCGIIDNWLGDNQVVADIFNQLTDFDSWS
ncbi:hypothetical protein DH2020_026986 [Rehmannia glutinosa]|uniref:Uncharacterized protein n=1 Tax=Rehmannia glutinosa TaxID=99300 RepID=A0ABR0VYC9_REHGL